MKINRKIAALTVAFVAVISLITPRSALASAITIDGVVYNKNVPMPGVAVVAWCGGISNFLGTNITDSDGHYVIHADSDNCALGTTLTVTTDSNNDGFSDGAKQTPLHTQTTASINVGDFVSVVIPEFDTMGIGAAALAGLGIIGFMRRRAHTKPM